MFEQHTEYFPWQKIRWHYVLPKVPDFNLMVHVHVQYMSTKIKQVASFNGLQTESGQNISYFGA